MSLINLHRRRVIQSSGCTPPDYTGFGITRLFGLFQTNISTLDYPVRVNVPGTAVGGEYIFWDNNCGISNSSKYHNTTTPPANANDVSFLTTLNPEYFVLNLFCHLSGVNLEGTETATRLISSSSLVMKNAKPSIKALGDRGINYVGGFPELASDQSYSMAFVVSNDTPDGVGTIFTNTFAFSGAVDNVSMFIDRRAASLHTIYRANATTTILSGPTQIDNSDYRVIILTKDEGTLTLNAYLGGGLIATSSFNVGTYPNDVFKLLARFSDTLQLTGDLGAAIVANRAWSAVEEANITTKLETQFNI